MIMKRICPLKCRAGRLLASLFIFLILLLTARPVAGNDLLDFLQAFVQETGRESAAIAEIQGLNEARIVAMMAPEIPAFEEKWGGARSEAWITAIGDRCAQAAGLAGVTFFVLGSKEVNALAVPGRRVYVTDGLIKCVSNDRDQVAGVIAHEIGHHKSGHLVKGIKESMMREIGAKVLARSLGANDEATTAIEIAVSLLDLKFSRDQEYEADREGVRIATRARFCPRGLPQALAAINNEGGLPKSLTFLSTHPYGKNRVKRAEKEAERQTVGPMTALAPSQLSLPSQTSQMSWVERLKAADIGDYLTGDLPQTTPAGLALLRIDFACFAGNPQNLSAGEVIGIWQGEKLEAKAIFCSIEEGAKVVRVFVLSADAERVTAGLKSGGWQFRLPEKRFSPARSSPDDLANLS